MNTALYHMVVTHPNVKPCFYTATTPKRLPIFIERAQKAWLSHFTTFVPKLAVAKRSIGGQPERGNELVFQCISNLAHRQRNIYWFHNCLISILFYSKVTTNTGQDCVSAHRMPWALTQILVPFIVLVRSPAVKWVKQFYGSAAAVVQTQCLFARNRHRLTSSQLPLAMRASMGEGIKILVGYPSFLQLRYVLQKLMQL
jgi:hypothetical protein